MPTTPGHDGLRSAAVLCLGALFALLAVGLTLLSSGVYRSTVTDAQAHFTQRTALGFLVNQVRRGDRAGGVSLGTFGDSDALLLTETVAGSTYLTTLYCFDGQLRELFTEQGTDLTPADGVAILPLTQLTLAQEDGLIRLTVTGAEGDRYTATVAPRTGIEGGSPQ